MEFLYVLFAFILLGLIIAIVAIIATYSRERRCRRQGVLETPLLTEQV